MMPLAIVLMWVELWLLGRLLIETPAGPAGVPVGGMPAPRRPAAPR
jgi:hypothetical protein